MVTSNRTIKWIENLADQELRINAGERTSIDLGNTMDEVLSMETTGFMRDLFDHFEYLIDLFNSRLSHTGLQIKLARSGKDSVERLDAFTLSRNLRKLLVTKPRPGIVQLQCDKNLGVENFGPAKTSVLFTGTIEACFGIFHDVQWIFLGNPVTAEQVAKHYLTEFIQASRADHASV